MAFEGSVLWGARECMFLAYGCTVGPVVGAVGLVVTPLMALTRCVWEKNCPKRPFCECAEITFGIPKGNISRITCSEYCNQIGFFACSLIPVIGGLLGAYLFLQAGNPWPNNWCCSCCNRSVKPVRTAPPQVRTSIPPRPLTEIVTIR